jgi:hypothetical protein
VRAKTALWDAKVIFNEPSPWREYTGDDPAAFVISLNLKRRHLSVSQRAMVAAKLANLNLGDNQHREGSSIELASDLLNVGRETVKRAKAVQRDGAEELQRGRGQACEYAARSPR